MPRETTSRESTNPTEAAIDNTALEVTTILTRREVTAVTVVAEAEATVATVHHTEDTTTRLEATTSTRAG